MISRQIVLYIALSAFSMVCLALAFTLNIHFIWLGLPSTLLISQSLITGWLPNFSWLKYFSKVDQPKHTLREVITRSNSGDDQKILCVIDSEKGDEANQSFANFQQLKRVLAKHNEKYHIGTEANDEIYQQLHNQRCASR